MDLSELNPEQYADQGAFCHLEHPVTGDKLYTDDGDAIGITALGMDSAAYRKAESKIANRRLARRDKQNTIEQIRANSIEMLAAVTVEFHNVVIDGEEKSAKQAAYVYQNHGWIREQLDQFVGNRANFTPTSQTA